MLNPHAFLLAAKLSNRNNNKKVIPAVAKIIEHVLYFDGCSKGNPGPAGAGAVLYEKDIEVWAGRLFVGEKETNNIAEYASLVLGLNEASNKGCKELLVRGDSLLVINQMKGTYKVNSDALRILYDRAKVLEKQFSKIEYEHIPREKNSRADQLANEGLIII